MNKISILSKKKKRNQIKFKEIKKRNNKNELNACMEEDFFFHC